MGVRRRRWRRRKLGVLRDTLGGLTSATRLTDGDRQPLSCRLTVLPWQSCCLTGESHISLESQSVYQRVVVDREWYS